MSTESKYRAPKIVAPRTGAFSLLRILLLLLVVMASGWYGYQVGHSGQDGLAVFKPSMQERIRQLVVEREDLRRQLSMAQQSAEMDQAVIKAIKERIKKFQNERLKMEEELTFLRGIVSADSAKKGLRIQKFQLTAGNNAGDFDYAFTVSQVINSGLVAKGRIYLELEGLQDGETVTLGLAKLADDQKRSHKMRFRYFQNVKGTLKIPAGFEPEKMTIEVKPDSKKLDAVTETFNWEPVS
jgi:hypothetical protein